MQRHTQRRTVSRVSIAALALCAMDGNLGQGAVANSQPLRIHYAWHGFDSPQVMMAAGAEPLNAYLERHDLKLPSHEQRLMQISRYQRWSQVSLCFGIAGMILALGADKGHHIVARTVGNGLWGTGIVGWLGINAAVQGDLADLSGDLRSDQTSELSFETQAQSYALSASRGPDFRLVFGWKLN